MRYICSCKAACFSCGEPSLLNASDLKDTSGVFGGNFREDDDIFVKRETEETVDITKLELRAAASPSTRVLDPANYVSNTSYPMAPWSSDSDRSSPSNHIWEPTELRRTSSLGVGSEFLPLEFTLEQMPMLSETSSRRKPRMAPVSEIVSLEEQLDSQTDDANLPFIVRSNTNSDRDEKSPMTMTPSRSIHSRAGSATPPSVKKHVVVVSQPVVDMSRGAVGSDSELALGSEVQYDMHMLPVKTLLSTDHLEKHEAMLQGGALVPWNLELRENSIFVSHQWLSFEHPDPENQHATVLKRVLTRLQCGKVSTAVQSGFPHRLDSALGPTTVKGKVWAKRLPAMHLWFDFACMPQEPGIHQARALASIPGYVERCALFLVLAPAGVHHSTREIIDFSSWRRRGWCRLELLSAFLAEGDPKILVCRGPGARPYFLVPSDALWSPPCQGGFACCERGHMKQSGVSIPCDKVVVERLLEQMLDAKLNFLFSAGKFQSHHFLKCRRGLLMGGACTNAGKKKVMREMSRSSWLHDEQWASFDKSVISTWQSSRIWLGRSSPKQATLEPGAVLLRRAILACDAGAAEELLQTGSVDLECLLPGEPLLGQPDGVKLLTDAMAFSTFDVVARLLDAGATSRATLACPALQGMDCLMIAAAYHQEENVRGWLQKFPTWEIHRRMRQGMDALMMAAAAPGESVGTLRELLQFRSDPSCRNEWGSTALHLVLQKGDFDLEAVRLLVSHRADVNAAISAPQANIRAMYRAARLAFRFGRETAAMRQIAFWEGDTPLHTAAKRGHVEAVKYLIEERADPLAANSFGLTPLEEAQEWLGELPDQIAQVLNASPD